MLRRTALLGVSALAAALFGAASSGGAVGSAFSPSDFLGEWTPNASAPAEVKAQPFTISSSTESAGRAASGANSINFDVYCKSGNAGVGSAAYFTLAYTWAGGGTMGGCQSGKTGGHAYFWGPASVAYFQLTTANGEDVLASHWGPESGGNVDYLKFTAVHPVARFLTHVKYAVVGKKGGRAVELVTASGAGVLEVAQKPSNCIAADVLDGAGTLTVDVVKVGGPSLVELDRVTVKVDPEGAYRSCDTQETLNAVSVTVTRSDPAEKDSCPVGSAGTLYLMDRSAKYGGDHFGISVPKCKLAESLAAKKAPKHSHVAVAVTFDEKGY